MRSNAELYYIKSEENLSAYIIILLAAYVIGLIAYYILRPKDIIKNKLAMPSLRLLNVVIFGQLILNLERNSTVYWIVIALIFSMLLAEIKYKKIQKSK
jgi:hypothetical protein